MASKPKKCKVEELDEGEITEIPTVISEWTTNGKWWEAFKIKKQYKDIRRFIGEF
jgi:ABC-type antimicrobial peptide transport system ATPase subunit